MNSVITLVLLGTELGWAVVLVLELEKLLGVDIKGRNLVLVSQSKDLRAGKCPSIGGCRNADLTIGFLRNILR
tara:strand:- start:35 stop:253 length:219 start_codon:yes stop_codon:yes gene_type:complete